MTNSIDRFLYSYYYEEDNTNEQACATIELLIQNKIYSHSISFKAMEQTEDQLIGDLQSTIQVLVGDRLNRIALDVQATGKLIYSPDKSLINSLSFSLRTLSDPSVSSLFRLFIRQMNIAHLIHLPFDQRALIEKIAQEKEKYPLLYSVSQQFNGLCELLCNAMLLKKFLGLGDPENKTWLTTTLTLSILDDPSIRNSHCVYVYSKEIQQDLPFPHSIYSPEEEIRLLTNLGIDFSLWKTGLHRLNISEVLKCGVYRWVGGQLRGHTFLIQRMEDDKYLLFDPSSGEWRGLSCEGIYKKVEEIRKKHSASKMHCARSALFLEDMIRYQATYRSDGTRDL